MSLVLASAIGEKVEAQRRVNLEWGSLLEITPSWKDVVMSVYYVSTLFQILSCLTWVGK